MQSGADYGRRLSAKMRSSSSSWVGSKSNHVLTRKKKINCSRVCLKAQWDHLFKEVSSIFVWPNFSGNSSATAAFTAAQTNCNNKTNSSRIHLSKIRRVWKKTLKINQNLTQFQLEWCQMIWEIPCQFPYILNVAFPSTHFTIYFNQDEMKKISLNCLCKSDKTTAS